MTFSVSSSLDSLTPFLRERAARQVPFATAKALTRTAWAVRNAEIEEMRRVFDRPNRFTLNSLFVERADKASLVAKIRFREFAGKGTPAYKYLGPHITGGTRNLKRFERALSAAGVIQSGQYVIPAPGSPQDAHGNFPRPMLVRVLTQLKASRDGSQNATNSARSRRNRRKQQFFVRPLKDPSRKAIWMRQNGKDRPVLLIISDAPTYQRRFDYYGVAERTIIQVFPREFSAAFRQAIGR